MVRSQGFKAFGLCAVVVGLTAVIMGGVAQAETGAKWTYINVFNGQLSTFNAALSPRIQASMDSASGSLEFTTGGGTKVAITCTGLTLEGNPSLGENGSISEGQATFTGCETFLNGALSKPCLPITSVTPDLIRTNNFKGLLQLFNLIADPYDDVTLLIPTVKDKSGNSLAVTIQLGEECAIAESVPVTGILVVTDTVPSSTLTHLVTHLIQEVPTLRLLKALGQPAKITGTANAFLGVGHGGIQWAAKPA